MADYKTHGFNKEWHKKVEKFIEETDQPFESSKYFIKYCVNKYIQEQSDKNKQAEIEERTEITSQIARLAQDNPDKSINEIVDELQD